MSLNKLVSRLALVGGAAAVRKPPNQSATGWTHQYQSWRSASDAERARSTSIAPPYSPMIFTNTRFRRRPSRLTCQPFRLA